jgi:site-specific DNA recombinase
MVLDSCPQAGHQPDLRNAARLSAQVSLPSATPPGATATTTATTPATPASATAPAPAPPSAYPPTSSTQAVIDALLATYQHTDLFDRAVAAAHDHAGSLRAHYQDEQAAIGTEIGTAEAAIDRYLDAFEAGTLAEATCGKRVEALAAKLADLRARQAELHDLLAATTVQAPTQAELDALAQQLHATIHAGPAPARKALIGALVHEVRVDSRAAIVPVFRVPAGQPPQREGSRNVRIGAPNLPLCEPKPAGHRPDHPPDRPPR